MSISIDSTFKLEKASFHDSLITKIDTIYLNNYNEELITNNSNSGTYFPVLVGILITAIVTISIFLLTKRKDKIKLLRELMAEERKWSASILSSLKYLNYLYWNQKYWVEYLKMTNSEDPVIDQKNKGNAYDNHIMISLKHSETLYQCRKEFGEYTRIVYLFNLHFKKTSQLLALLQNVASIYFDRGEFEQPITDLNDLYVKRQLMIDKRDREIVGFSTIFANIQNKMKEFIDNICIK